MNRPLTAREWEVLDHLLAVDGPAARRARTYVDRIVVSGGCDCGCGTIQLALAEGPAASGHVVLASEASVRDDPSHATVLHFADAETGAPTCIEVDDVSDAGRPALPDARLLAPAERAD